MKDKRQGNDLKVAWSIFMQDGEPFRLDGKDVSLYLKNMFGRKELNDFVTTGNIIQWTFYGKDQKNPGKYSLEMVINEGEKGMITTDKCDFVNLVSCSCKLQGGEDAPNVETESIELTSTLEYVAGGMSEEEVLNLLDGKVDKVEGKGLSTNDYTDEDRAKLAGLENYDDSGIKEDLAKKAEKSEIPTKMSQLEQDIEIGGEVDLSDYPTREEVSETYLPREEFNERIEGYATHDSVQELSENVTELSAEVSGLSEGIALRNVGAVDTDESVDEPDLPTPSASNEWKCIYDRRPEVGVDALNIETYSDGAPLKAQEAIVQILVDTQADSNKNGYVYIKSTTNNKIWNAFGIIDYQNNSASADNKFLQQIHFKASPIMYMVAEIYNKMQGAVNSNVEIKAGIGSEGPQVYEDITLIRLVVNGALAYPPHIKVFVR